MWCYDSTPITRGCRCSIAIFYGTRRVECRWGSKSWVMRRAYFAMGVDARESTRGACVVTVGSSKHYDSPSYSLIQDLGLGI
jgi:hypothetical protein